MTVSIRSSAVFLVLLLGCFGSCLALGGQKNIAGFSVSIRQAPATSHARMLSRAGGTVEVITTDHAAIAPAAAGGLTAFLGAFAPLGVSVASAMSFWLLY